MCNDFALNQRGELVLITGSNMSGKSTFLRTVGVNLCLAYAGGPVNARVFRDGPAAAFYLHPRDRLAGRWDFVFLRGSQAA